MPKGVYERTEWHKERLRGPRPWTVGKFCHRKGPSPLKGRPSPLKGRKFPNRKMPPRSDEHRRKHALAISGPNHWHWRGGITSEIRRVRKNVEMQIWRRHVFEQDDYTCATCGERGGDLKAHHIKPFAYFPEFRFNIKNGITLCSDCHKECTRIYRIFYPMSRPTRLVG